MMKDSNWSDKIADRIDQQVKEFISIRDYRFYQIEKLKRIANILEKQPSCMECKYAKADLDSIVSDLDRLINKSGVNKSEYEKRVEKLLNHLKAKHQIYQAYHFTYNYSAIYALAGVVFGLLLSYGLYFSFNPSLFFFCAGAATVVGNFLGARKDRFCRKNGKQL